MPKALSAIGWSGIAAVGYLAVVSTILRKTYPASTVAPFSLLVPVFGTLFASLMFGERIGPNSGMGAVLVLVGSAMNAWSAGAPAPAGEPPVRSRFRDAGGWLQDFVAFPPFPSRLDPVGCREDHPGQHHGREGRE